MCRHVVWCLSGAYGLGSASVLELESASVLVLVVGGSCMGGPQPSFPELAFHVYFRSTELNDLARLVSGA